MGCEQSKLENEEAVARCKERKLYIKQAVTSRNAFAAAHSAYAMSLKNTGAALSDYAHGEVLQDPNVADLGATPPEMASIVAAMPRLETFVPPPPLPDFSPMLLKRAASMPEGNLESKVVMKQKGMISEEGEDNVVMKEERVMRQRMPPPPSHRSDLPWDFFELGVDGMQGVNLSDVTEEDDEIEVYDETPKRAVEKKIDEMMVAETPPSDAVVAVKNSKKGKQVEMGPTGMEDRRKSKALGIVNLLQLFIDLDDRFLKASECAREVSKMLEANRLHYNSNFAESGGKSNHSARVMQVITWNGSRAANADNGKDDSHSEDKETHAIVLDKLLAWEKKLYEEVKAAELMKLEYRRKFAALNRLKRRGSNAEALEKVKAAVSHLHTKYIVDMQSLDSAMSEINRLRDEQLYPKLVDLVDGMAVMWDSMKDHHENQTKLVLALRSLDVSQSPKETSEVHHGLTCQLQVTVNEWQEHFQELVNYQKEYIKALNSWLKFNIIPIKSSLKERVSSPPRIPNPPIMYLLGAWLDNLDRLQEGIAKSAISNFAAVIKIIVELQDNEMNLKSKCEDTRKELIKRTKIFEDWYHKYMLKHTGGDADSETPDLANDDAVVERKFTLDGLKKRLDEDEDAYRKLCLHVREKSHFNLKSQLVELLRAWTEFTSSCSEMYKSLSSIAHSQNLNGSC